ncbi:MAG: hypothetical protein JWO71_3141 [Candidatus Acidoferrum typicum]|nr:hypothetical protein [Candidatus Acidoferrum typicum]
MAAEFSKNNRQRGMSMIEIMVVVFITLVMSALASPNIMQVIYNMRLRSAASDLAGLMQQARIMAAKDNTPYAIRYTTLGSSNIAYVDLNLDGTYAAGEPLVQFSGTVVVAGGAPSGSGVQPAAYVLPGDTGSGSYNNTSVLGFSARGLPCNYDSSTTPATCTTPAVKPFGYYLTDTRMGAPGWATVSVTKGGRTKALMWDGTSWH